MPGTDTAAAKKTVPAAHRRPLSIGGSDRRQLPGRRVVASVGSTLLPEAVRGAGARRRWQYNRMDPVRSTDRGTSHHPLRGLLGRPLNDLIGAKVIGVKQDQPRGQGAHHDQDPHRRHWNRRRRRSSELGVASPAMASTTTSHTAPGAASSKGDPAGIYAPNTPIVINRSNRALTITSLTVDRGAAWAYWSGPGPYTGQVIPAGDSIRVNWLEFFAGSEVD